MITLHALGLLPQSVTFERQLDVWRAALIAPANDSVRAFLRENLDALEASGKKGALAVALRLALGGYFNWGPWRLARYCGHRLRHWAHERRPESNRQPG